MNSGHLGFLPESDFIAQSTGYSINATGAVFYLCRMEELVLWQNQWTDDSRLKENDRNQPAALVRANGRRQAIAALQNGGAVGCSLAIAINRPPWFGQTENGK
jgi:hypothetical protein